MIIKYCCGKNNPGTRILLIIMADDSTASNIRVAAGDDNSSEVIDCTHTPTNNSAAFTFAEFQKMPEWKKELIQKRKNASKGSANNSFEDGKPSCGLINPHFSFNCLFKITSNPYMPSI